MLYKFALTAFCERLLQVKLHAHATAAASQPGTVAGSGSTLRCEMQHSDLVADSVRHRLGGARGRQDLSLSRPDATHCPHLSVRYLHRGADVAVQRHACAGPPTHPPHTLTYIRSDSERGQDQKQSNALVKTRQSVASGRAGNRGAQTVSGILSRAGSDGVLAERAAWLWLHTAADGARWKRLRGVGVRDGRPCTTACCDRAASLPVHLDD